MTSGSFQFRFFFIIFLSELPGRLDFPTYWIIFNMFSVNDSFRSKVTEVIFEMTVYLPQIVFANFNWNLGHFSMPQSY